MTSVGRGVGRIISAALAAAAVTGIVVGVPFLLWTVSSELLRDRVPTDASLVDLLLRPDDGTLLMAFLAIVGAGAWFVLTVSIVSEMVAAVAGRPAPRIALPGFGWGRTVAAALVTTMLSAAPAVAAPVAFAATTMSAEQHPLPGAEPVASAAGIAEQNSGNVHIVAHRDTLWRIAEVALGDPMRWREIYDLNVGRVQPDGGRLTESSVLVVGWRLLLPTDAAATVTVRPGDTLTGLAAEHLGDAGLADEMFRANAATPQPGGEQLTDPDEIRPGWTLRLPSVLDAAEPDRPSVDAPLEQPESSTQVDPIPAPPVPTSTPSAPPASPGEPEEDGDARTPASPGTAAPTTAEPPNLKSVDQPDTATQAWIGTALGMSALVGGGVLASLAVRRRRQVRLRPYRHRVAVPTDEDGRAEWSLARSNSEKENTWSAAHRLDLALRSMTRPGVDEGGPVPSLRFVRLTDADVLATTGGGVLPEPFLQVGDLDLWSLDVASDLPAPANELAGCCAPFPALVSVGIDDDRVLMIDLEERGVLRLGGDPERCEALLRHLAAELATSPMAEDCEVLLVGLGVELAALNPDRLVVCDLHSAREDLRRKTTTTSAALERHQVTSAVEGRLRGVAADSWLPTILLVGPDGVDRAEIDELVAHFRRGTATAVVLVDPDATDVVVTESGLVEMVDADDGPWTVAELSAEASSRLAAVLDATVAPAAPVGRASDPRSWADGMDEDGALSSDPEDESVVDEAIDHAPTRQQAGGIDLAQREPNGVGVESECDRRLAIVEFQDPDLDEDVRAWHDTGVPSRPMIAILGEPVVRAPGTTPSARPMWFAEVLVYLSLHPAGVAAAKAQTDLWPDGHRISPATVRHAFYGARRWAGRGLGGDPGATFVSDLQTDNTYRLRGHLLDWDLFRRLRKRGQARWEAGHPGAVTDYEAALGLIRGPVLTPLRPGGYGWLNNHDQRHDLQIPGFLIDAAHELVDIALDSGDTAAARRAAERARLVDVDVAYDRPLTDLMRIAHAEDNRAELELYASVLLDARGFDVPEDLAPDSFAVINELLLTARQRPRP